MLAEAEANRREDEQLRKAVEACNALIGGRPGSAGSPNWATRRRRTDRARAGDAGRRRTPSHKGRRTDGPGAVPDVRTQQVFMGCNHMPSGGGNGEPTGDGQGAVVGDDDVVDAVARPGTERQWPAPQSIPGPIEDDGRAAKTRQKWLPPSLISDKELAKLRTAGGALPPDLDICASGMPANPDRERTTERSRVAGAWLPIVDNLERRSITPVTSPTRLSRACGSILEQALQVSSSSAIRAMRRQGCPSTRSVTTGGGCGRQAGTPRLGRLSSASTGLRRRFEANCGRRPWWSADAGSDASWPATTTKSARASGRDRRPRPPAGVPHSGVEASPPTSTGDPAAEGAVQEVNEAYHVPSAPKPAALRPIRRRLLEGSPRIGKSGRAPVRVASGAEGLPRVAGARRRGLGGAGGISIEDLFGDMFGGSGGSGRYRRRPGSGAAVMVEEARPGRQRRSTRRPHDGVKHTRRCHRRSAETAAGEGGRGSGDGPAGDLHLRVPIEPHPRFRLTDATSPSIRRCPPWEAGARVTVAIELPAAKRKT